jgi:hypothetical protein
MTKQQFINSVLAEPGVVEMIPNSEQIIDTYGNYQKGYFVLVFNEPQGGKNFRQVWFIRNTVTDETDWQTANTVNQDKNTIDAKRKLLEDYLEATFFAYNILVFNGDNWAEVEVYSDTNPTITKKKIVVFKIGNNPVTHRDLVAT